MVDPLREKSWERIIILFLIKSPHSVSHHSSCVKWGKSISPCYVLGGSLVVDVVVVVSAPTPAAAVGISLILAPSIHTPSTIDVDI